MIRKLIKFLKKCWGKKAAYAYAGLMLTACILTYKLYFASGSNIFKSEEEKASVASSVAEALPAITQAVQQITTSLKESGRLIYMGAGTSGRLGVLDAAECVPTFGVSPDVVVGLIAGGPQAMTVAVEGAEDSLTLGKEDLQALNLTAKDTEIGRASCRERV